MKVIKTDYWEVPKIAATLVAAAAQSDKSISQICRDAKITRPYWYSLIKNEKRTIKYSTLMRILAALNMSPEVFSFPDDISEFATRYDLDEGDLRGWILSEE